MRKQIGRPKLPKSEVKGVVTLRLTTREKRLVYKAARAAGQRPAEWMREALLRASGQAASP